MFQGEDSVAGGFVMLAGIVALLMAPMVLDHFISHSAAVPVQQAAANN